MKEGGKDEVLTAQEAAEYLKMALSSLYRYMREGKIPCFKIGGRWRSNRSVLDQWMEKLSGLDDDRYVRKLNREVIMERKKGKQGGETGLFDIGIGGVFKGLGSLFDLVSEMAEKGETELRREGEIGARGGKGVKAVYGFSVRIGGEGRPTVERFGNIREDKEKGPVVDEVREPMVDVFDEGEQLVVVAELPGVDEKDIKHEVKEDILTVTAETSNRKYYKELLLPAPVDQNKISSSYKNGILEMKLWKAIS